MEKKVLKVGFLNYFYFQLWMGGVTYFMNLFQAMKTVRNPVLKPYILKFREPGGEQLLKLAEFLEKDEIHCADLENLPTARDYNVDIISHQQECRACDGIAWIADFQHKHLPEMFDAAEIEHRDKVFAHLAKTNRLVILSSDDALQDFRTFYPDYAYKGRCLHFVSIPEPGALGDVDAASACARLGVPERFFYVPNQFWKHKNHIVVMKAVARLKKRGVDVTVICSGKTADTRFPTYFDELMAFCSAEGIDENVKVLGLIDRNDVYFLQRQCVSLINPSKFEGWSSSVEEAKSVGKTIILSDLPVHLEQDPPRGRFFPRDDDVRLAEIMEQVWDELPPGPDAELERLARERLPGRIRTFGEEFKRILLEAYEGPSVLDVPPDSRPSLFMPKIVRMRKLIKKVLRTLCMRN